MKLKIFLAGLALIASQISFAASQEINVAYAPKSFDLHSLIIKHQKLLEKEFAPDGVQIHWHDYENESTQAQAMARGDLDISPNLNSTTALLANAENNPIVIFAGHSKPTKMYGILSKPGATLTIEDLEDKTVALPDDTFLQHFFSEALKQNGVDPKTVKIVRIDPEQALEAVLNGKVDAALLSSNAIIEANQKGARTVATARGIADLTLFATASKAFADSHPDYLQRYQKVYRQALQWIKDHPDEAFAIAAKEKGITMEEARLLTDWSNYFDTLNFAHIEGVKADQSFLLSHNLMKAPINVDAIFFRTVKQNKS